MYEFAYQRPQTLDEAAALLTECEDAKLIAGGQTLLPALKMRLAQPSDLIDLAAIPNLKGICRDGDRLVIGALTTHAAVAASAEVKAAIPALAALADGIGDPQVRNRGTLGGSVANNDPGADYPAAVLGLNATVITNQGEYAADDFFTGMFETALTPGEIVTAVSFPIPKRAGYQKFPNPASRYCLVAVMVADTADGVRVAVTGAGSCVFRVPDMEQALAQNFAPAALEGLLIPADELNDDLHGSADYRAHLVTVMAKRAVAAAHG